MFLLVVSCLVATAYADSCCMPTLWEGVLGFQLASRQSATQQSYMRGGLVMSYDAVNQMIAQYQSIDVDGNHIEQRVIIDYKQGIVNVIAKDGSCTRAPSGPWTSNCIPANATSSDMYFGLAANSVNSKSFNIDYGTYKVYMTVTADTCVPLTEDVIGTFGQSTIIERVVYLNMTAGISDRSVFSVPLNCATANIGPAIPGLGKRALF